MSSNEENIYVISLDSGMEKTSPKISQFTHNASCIKFVTSRNLNDFTVMLFSSIEDNISVTPEGEKLIKSFNEESGATEVLWYPGGEITAMSGCVTYQLAAFGANNSNEVWYSCEGRLIVTDSIDTTNYSAQLLGSEPNLLVQILNSLNQHGIRIEGKVDKADGMGLSQNSFTNEHKESLEKSLEDIQNLFRDMPVVDMNYSATSQNPQSGLAVAAAIFEALAAVRDGVPNSLNTLAKLANAIGNNENFAEVIFSDIGAIRDSALGIVHTINDHIEDQNNPHNTRPGDIGLGNVDNTSDEDKPLSRDARDALDSKVDKEPGKGLSTNDFTDMDKAELTEVYHLIGDMSILDTDHADTIVGAINEVYNDVHKAPVRAIPSVLSANTEYNFGTQTTLNLNFPWDCKDGDVICIRFVSGETPTNLLIDMSNTTVIELVPEENTWYEIYAKYDDSILAWVLGYAEYSLDGE